MNVFLWILQIVLAAMFALAGVQKSTQPKEKLVTRLPWVEDFSAGTVRLIGIVELLGGDRAGPAGRTRHRPGADPTGRDGLGDRDGAGRQHPPSPA
jgi:DoxX-like family